MDKTSNYRGVSASGAKWRARFRDVTLGTYETQEDAARAYDAIAFAELGDDANLNFPTTQPETVTEPQVVIEIAGEPVAVLTQVFSPVENLKIAIKHAILDQDNLEDALEMLGFILDDYEATDYLVDLHQDCLNNNTCVEYDDCEDENFCDHDDDCCEDDDTQQDWY